MGFKRAKTVKLTWADGEFEGLEVRVKRISVEKFLHLAPLLDADFGDFKAEDIAEMRGMFLEVGKLLASWNLEDDESGEAIPCTPEAFLQQDLGFVVEIAARLNEAIVGVPAPLERQSSGGEPSLEASLPMAPLSESLAS